MARSVPSKPNPALLAWARDDAGFDIAEAARKLRVKPELLTQWESSEGKARPTLAQLRRVAELYKRPLALFFMKKPPSGFQVMRDFRRLPGEVAGVLPPTVRVELRRAQERRGMALTLSRDLELQPPEFRLQCRIDDDAEKIGAALRTHIGMTADEQAQWREPRQAFTALRRKFEAAGILVFMIPTLPPEVLRGFSVPAQMLPVIAVNRKDAWSARTFTLLHEACHLMLRTGGLCDLHEEAPRPAEEDRIEVFCNAVAASALVPATDLLHHVVVRAHPQRELRWTQDELQQLAARFACSRDAVLRRLLTFQRTSRAFYREMHAQYAEEAKAAALSKLKKKEMKRNIPRDTIGIFGPMFLGLAFDNYHQRRITLNDLSEILGVKARHVPKIEQSLGAAA